MTGVRCLGLVANCGKPQAAPVVGRLARHARRLGMRVLADADTAALVAGIEASPDTALAERCDMLIAVGGDGTLLRVAREFAPRSMPVMGVNIGRLGFLTAISEPGIPATLRALADGEFIVSNRHLLAGSIERKGRRLHNFLAVNDVVVRTGASSRMVSLEVAINGTRVSSYFCDGIIVASPSGSTGHSLSAGGPILSPETRAFVISLVCPHSLNSRPLVIPDQRVISVGVSQCAGEVILSADGQLTRSLVQGDRVSVRRSRRSARLVYLPGYDHFAVLRQKLNWSGRYE
jgi:NAD+ kinase